jgi:hypothetical protein
MDEPEDDIARPDAQADQFAHDIQVGAVLLDPDPPAGDPQVQDGPASLIFHR